MNWNTPQTGSYNAFGAGESTTIYMYDGSFINMRNGGSPKMPAIQLMADPAAGGDGVGRAVHRSVAAATVSSCCCRVIAVAEERSFHQE